MELGFHRGRRLMHGSTRAWVSLALLALTAVMVPWTLWLSVVLPAKHTSHDWDATWVGFDLVLLTALGLTAVGYRKHWPILPIVASAAGVLLFADAWFDVTLSGANASSVTLALVAEIPVGAFCLWIAWQGMQDLLRESARSRGDRRVPGPASPRPHTPDRRRPVDRSQAG
jgi:hypothetical protein